MVLVEICFGELRRLRDSLGARAKLCFPQKKKKKGSDVELWHESAYNRKWYLMYRTLSLFRLKPTVL